MAAALMHDNLHPFPDSPLEEDTAYPCKRCGEILEEGKAFELAGHRWHIDCFRCNTCDTLLDSDANLLLLGDGSLICNNCTYSCSSCGNKIEDLAILTGDQAFCASCFKCRSCKRKIENLRYARTSQGIFCMDCHEALMKRRRKKTAKTNAAAKSANTEKSLPAIPPSDSRHAGFMPPLIEPSLHDKLEATVPEIPSVSTTLSGLRHEMDSDSSRPATSQNPTPGGLTLPPTTYRDQRRSYNSQRSDVSAEPEEFLIPLAFDPNPPKQQPQQQQQAKQPPTVPSPQITPQVRMMDRPKDYFNRSASHPLTSSTSQSPSPHIAYQERQRAAVEMPAELPIRGPTSLARSASTTAAISAPSEAENQSSHSLQLARNNSRRSDKFKLQEAPKHKRALSERSTPRADTTPSISLQASPDIREQEISVNDVRSTPRASYETSPAFTDGFSSPQPILSPSHAARDVPKRGDSLEDSKKTIPRKEINATPAAQPLTDISNATPGSAKAPPPPTRDHIKANGGKVISAPISSPGSHSVYSTPDLIANESTSGAAEKFVQPRAPPAPPSAHGRNESIGTQLSDSQKSPRLPHYSAGGDFTLEEDISRILAMDEPTANESFLRRVSNSVRHGRSYSDKAGRFSRDRWPKSPIANISGQEISSPITSSPEHREELSWFKNELRRERQKNLEREKRISELEAHMNAAADISQVNVELKEKRSTMVVLDTQKEIVVRELEVLTDHIAHTKKSGEPLDMNKMQSAVLRDLAEALDKLKRSFTPQIETLVQQRNDLLEEIANLNQSKDKSFQEFEQLSNKNAQLAEFNNQLVDQIQNIYKTNRNPGMEELKPNGLGIYSHQKDKSQTSVDTRDVKMIVPGPPSVGEANMTYEAGEVGTVQSLAGAQVVEMKKGAVAKRFDWRRGQKMAKGLTKGVKGAFASAQQNYGRDMQFAETGAYGAQGQLHPDYANIPNSNLEANRAGGWAFGSTNAKPGQGRNGLYASSINTSTPSLLADAVPTNLALFGTELKARADFEKTSVPGIVKRCITEVETRGMDVEGIYRKSGGNSQVQHVKEGFEKQPLDFDISDQDLDIHAVTSGLKQYFRKLPTPLITYDVYDSLIELTKIPEGPNQKHERIEGLRASLDGLPKVHYDVLGYLMAHLARVALLDKENLMSPLNIAVVFAPTIMRPESVTRELSDTKAKNEIVMWMVQDCETIFGRT